MALQKLQLLHMSAGADLQPFLLASCRLRAPNKSHCNNSTRLRGGHTDALLFKLLPYFKENRFLYICSNFVTRTGERDP